MSATFCRFCGTFNVAGSKRCMFCGKPITPKVYSTCALCKRKTVDYNGMCTTCGHLNQKAIKRGR